jgi:muconolactone D-isomerase
MAAEAERRAELIESGALRRLWRDPGHWANWTLWCVSDADDLHALLTSLPFHPWMDVTVHPLARHEADPGWTAATDDLGGS